MVTRRLSKQITDGLDDNVVRGAFSAHSKATRNAFISTDNLDMVDAEAESGGSSTGAAGAGGPLVDLSAFGLTGTAEFLLAQAIRKGEARFGWVPDTKDPNQVRREADARNAGPKKHPLLRGFDGIDPKLNPDLQQQDPEVQSRVAEELRLQAQLQNRNENQNVFTALPTNRPV